MALRSCNDCGTWFQSLSPPLTIVRCDDCELTKDPDAVRELIGAAQKLIEDYDDPRPQDKHADEVAIYNRLRAALKKFDPPKTVPR